ncbi:MAG: exo-alpha-sialidase [Saprospiraceae bacterium]|nr:exo-alpha-sialidase [Saprospiraceae bacterium]
MANDFFSWMKAGMLAFCFLFVSSCSKKTGLVMETAMKFPTDITNVTISSSGYHSGPCEPSICISPANNDIILAGSIIDNVHFSSDGGITWKNTRLKSPYGVFGDPVTLIDGTGKMFYAHLSNPKAKPYNSVEFLDRIVVQSSMDGILFSDGSFPEADQVKDHDKHWLGLDPATNDLLMSWTEFDKYGSKDWNDKSRILFSVSRDQGESWSKAITISQHEGDCVDDDYTTEGAVPAVGTDGTYYIVWSVDEKIYLDISHDKGKTWLTEDRLIATQPGGWAFDIPGISRSNGMPVIKVDHSKGHHRGTIYVSWSDQRNGKDDTDVWCITSKDQGKSWSKPVRVNDDKAGKQQFFSAMDVDQSTGHVFFVFYDRRNHKDELTDVYVAWSSDGGKHFSNHKISETPFAPSADVFFGDYNDISAVNGRIRPIWTRMDNGQLSVLTALIDFN